MKKLTTNNRIKTREEVEHEIKRAIWWMEKMAMCRTGASYFLTIASLLKKLNIRDLPDLSGTDGFEEEDGVAVEGSKWCYEIRINAYGVTLQLVKLCVMHDDDPYLYISEDYSMNLIEVKSRRLTLEEFGKKNDVEADTVRQWIRRGKLPMAIKSGTDWRIPELASLARGDDFRLYYIEGDLVDAPEELICEKKYNMVSIYKERGEDRKQQWSVILEQDGETVEEKKMLTKDKERIERYLVSQPAAVSSHGNICWITEKNWYPMKHIWGEWASDEDLEKWEKELQGSIATRSQTSS